MSKSNRVALSYPSDPSYRFLRRWDRMLCILSNEFDPIPF